MAAGRLWTREVTVQPYRCYRINDKVKISIGVPSNATSRRAGGSLPAATARRAARIP